MSPYMNQYQMPPQPNMGGVPVDGGMVGGTQGGPVAPPQNPAYNAQMQAQALEAQLIQQGMDPQLAAEIAGTGARQDMGGAYQQMMSAGQQLMGMGHPLAAFTGGLATGYGTMANLRDARRGKQALEDYGRWRQQASSLPTGRKQGFRSPMAAALAGDLLEEDQPKIFR